MDGSSSRNGEEANCSTHPQERGSSEDTGIDWSITFTGLWNKQDDMACRALWAGLAHTATPYNGGDFLCRRRRTHVGQPCSGKVRCRCYRLHGVPMVCHLPHCECRSLCSAPRSTSKMLLHLLWFSFRAFERTRRYDGNFWCYVITSVYGAFGADVGNSASTASNGRSILEQ